MYKVCKVILYYQIKKRDEQMMCCYLLLYLYLYKAGQVVLSAYFLRSRDLKKYT